jgi:hypothetical protein
MYGYFIFGIVLIFMCGLLGVFEPSYAACNLGLTFRLPFISVYFSILFTHFRITVYPATVFVSGCSAPAPVSVEKYGNENGRAIFRSFPSVFIFSGQCLLLAAAHAGMYGFVLSTAYAVDSLRGRLFAWI